MKNYSHHLILSFLLLITSSTYSQNLPAYRRTNWALAGYRGTIPHYTVIKNIVDFGGVSDGTAANDLALQNAITSSGGQNAIIYFPSGTFLFNSSVLLRSGLVLRGEGAENTTLKFDLGGTGNLVTIAGTTSSAIVNIATSALAGQSSLTVDDASLFEVNDYLKIYQDDTSLVNDAWALESVGQIVSIDSIAGQTIYFSNALRRNYLLHDVPRIRRLTMATGTGIECLKIKRLDFTHQQSSNIYFLQAANCWVKGVESDSSNFAHVRITNSSNIEVTNCYFHGAFSYGATGEGYGICCEYTSGECLIENNIFGHLRHSMLLQSGANGNVFDYNYSTGAFKSETIPYDLSGDLVLHGNYPYLNLFEGNIVQNIIVDASHGINGHHNTLLRNRAESYGLIMSPDAADSTNIIGNEINGVDSGKGFYLASGAGNFEYGNNRKGSIIPAGTITVNDKSYVYTSKPAFWNVFSPWPATGPSNVLGTGTIPAKERYRTGSNLTYCLPTSAVTYTFTGTGNWNNAANWANNIMPPQVLSNGSEIIIDPPKGGKCILNIPYSLNPGVKMIVRTGKNFVVNGNLHLTK